MKVLNFGSLNVDYVYNVEHFVRAGETLASTKMEKFCGGKGLNQSIALARAGAQVWHAGLIGNDGEALRDLLKENNINTNFVRLEAGASGHAIIQVDNKGQNGILLFGGANQRIDKRFVDEVLAAFDKGDMLVLQNEISCLDYIVDKAHEKGMRIALNPSPINENLDKIDMSKVSIFILNEIEGNAISGKDSPNDMLMEIRAKYPLSCVVLTLGKRGVACEEGSVRASHGIYDVKVADTTAAGDTFTGYYLASIISGESMEEALRRASVASSLAVSVLGAAPSIPTLKAVLSSKIKLV